MAGAKLAKQTEHARKGNSVKRALLPVETCVLRVFRDLENPTNTMVWDRINMVDMIAPHLVDHVNPVINFHCNSVELESGKSARSARPTIAQSEYYP